MTCVHCHTPLPDGAQSCPACGIDASPGATGRRGSRRQDELLERLRYAVGDQYEIRELLGQGGMGAVYLALDRKLEREVAIKVLPTDLAHDENFVGRFQHEAKTAAKLDHPGIIPIYAVESDEDLHYFVMKFVAGRGLDSVISAGPVPIDLTQRILWEAACALGHAHARGVVHRDIKPANIMIEGTGRVMLADFGISKALKSASQFTATGQVIGTPHYMSPEQAKGTEVTGASDQYSLGIVGYRMVTGRLPFEDDSVHTIIYKHVFEDPEPVEQVQPRVPRFLAQAIRRAMAKEPTHRYPTMEDFATAVWPEHPVQPETRDSAQLAARQPLTSTEVPTEMSEPTVITVETKRRRALRWVPALLVVVLGLGAAFAMFTPAGNRLLEQIGLREAAPAPQPTSPPIVALRDTGAQTEPTAPLDTAAVAPAQTQPPVQPPAEQEESPRAPARRTPPRTQPVITRPIAPRIGYLTVSAVPVYGTLYIDGREYGDTPQIRLELAPGTYVLEIRREGYVTVVDTVTITDGNEVRRTKTLTRGGT